MDERRKATRVGLVSEVEIQRTTLGSPEGLAWGSDLNEGGIGLLLWNNSLQIGEEIHLKISVPGSSDPIAMKGMVVWSQPAKPGFRVGIRFKEVDALGQARILQLVTERWAQLSARPSVTTPLSSVSPKTAQAGLSVQQAGVEPATSFPAATAPPAKPLRMRKPFLTILLAVVALVLLVQNIDLRRSLQELKATVAALQAR